MSEKLTTNEAEGTGLEPATPFGAPHLQCGAGTMKHQTIDLVRAGRAERQITDNRSEGGG